MNYQDYKTFIKPFNPILKNTPITGEAFEAHFHLIQLKITNLEVFQMAFMEHLKTSDFFPSHIDIYKHGEAIAQKIWERDQNQIPEIVEFKRLKRLEVEQNDIFINNKDREKVDEYRNNLLDTQKKIEEMKQKYAMLNALSREI